MNPGDSISHYRILGTLGKGGMGEVYTAEDTKLHRRVALKLLPSALAADPDRRKRFEREAQAVAALNHPGIVTIHSVEVDGPVPFLTMELVEGQPLRQAIPPGGVPVDSLLRTGMGITDAVAAAHQRGIVHRDLKPANVIVCPDGRVKVLDFGLAKLHEVEPAPATDASTHVLNQVKEDLTGEGRIVGTVAYMSPEQAEGKPIDQRSDIFSLGVMLHEMATGERPFKGDTEISVISAIIKDTPGSITDSRPDLPVALARIVKRCLVKDPHRRYQSARDLHTDLEDLKQDLDSGVLSTPSGVAAIASKPSARRWSRPAAYVAAGAAVVAAIATAWFAIARHGSDPRLFVPDRFSRLTDTGTAFLASLSPDGRYVVHVKRENQIPGLWIRQTGTSSDVRIVPPSEARIKAVTFSPDGAFVYYNTYPRQSGVATLYRVPALGGPPARVIEDVDSGVSFSPDGSQFTFMRGRPAENIMMLMLANADGSGARQLVAATGQTTFDAETAPWSPDGKTIVVAGRAVTNGVTRARLTAVDVSSSRLTPFGGDWLYIHGVAWMPDGRSVLVAAVENESDSAIQLWQVGWPRGQRHRITSGVNGYDNVSLSADGRTIATIEGERHSNIWVYPIGGGAGRQITSAVRGNIGGGGLTWTPDGRIVYGAPPGDGANQLWIMDADGGHVTQLTSMKDFAALPAVSPDGKSLYFNGGQDRSMIWKMPLEGGDPVQLTSGKFDFRAIVSADGNWVYYTSNENGRNRAMKIPAAGGTATALTPPELLFNAWALSADGTKLFGYGWNAAGRRSQAMTVALDGGATAFLDNVPSGAQLMPDGKAWLHADVRNGVAGLFVKPVEGGADRLFVELGQEQSARVAISMDGRNLAMVRGRSTNDVVLIKAK